ncbi:MAG: hypothetical protein ACTSVI_10515 [Promethearchaeota archaeon]
MKNYFVNANEWLQAGLPEILSFPISFDLLEKDELHRRLNTKNIFDIESLLNTNFSFSKHHLQYSNDILGVLDSKKAYLKISFKNQPLSFF